ncbi:MAG: alpha/beta hydrolase [Anaerolineaceae bacterium]|nr:alpha/beta hydrolase [Anaerolineaceae bacterium]
MENTKKKKINLNRKFWLILLVSILAIGLLVGLNWATYARPPLSDALSAMESDALVVVSEEPWLTFSPAGGEPETGFIFYPGGRVDPQGYAPLMRGIASENYLVIIPEMPLNMAPFKPDIADEIIAYYPEIDHWIIGGHSVGGTFAARYTNQNRETIDGLVIWASYPAGNMDLSDYSGLTTSIYGSQDPGVNDVQIEENKHLLPAQTNFVRIDGGDHHQFGSYLIKPEENHAIVDRASQHAAIINATLDILNEVSNLPGK